MTSPSITRYAKTGDLDIAYQVVGGGSLDVVSVHGWVSNLEMVWDQPALARLNRRLASFSRLISWSSWSRWAP